MEIQSSPEEYNYREAVSIQEVSELLARNWRSQDDHQRCLIHRVPPHLRARQPKEPSVYDPSIISIGPYHHGKPQFHDLEKFKYLCLDWFVKGDWQQKQILYHLVLREAARIRACYADVYNGFSDTKLALMMLLDACFLINLMTNCTSMKNNNYSDWLGSFGMASSIQFMISDVFKLENQIPFRVIELLMSFECEDETHLVKRFLGWTMKVDIDQVNIRGENEEPPIHILAACRRAVELMQKPESRSKWWPRFFTRISKTTLVDIHVAHTSCRSITDLKAKGIYFRPSRSRSFMDVAFESCFFYGQLKLPVQYVSPQTQVMLSNLIAYEVSPNSKMMPVVLAYVVFMKSLIETPADVKELQRNRILVNSFPNHEQVVKVFGEIDTFGYGDLDIFAQVKHRVEAHCGNRWKTWIADLIHTRFQSPWTTIAMVAAAFLLCLTFLQTYFTIHPV